MMSLPTWVKAAATLGGATLLSVYFSWWITARVSASVDDTSALMRTHVIQSQTMQESLDHLIELVRIQCVNAAKNPSERGDCLRAGSYRRTP